MKRFSGPSLWNRVSCFTLVNLACESSTGGIWLVEQA